MNEVEIRTLWLMFGYIGTHWGTASFCTMSESQFEQVIASQIQLDRRYREYYIQAVDEYSALLEKYGDPEAALRALFTENQLPAPRLPDVANYVLLEFMRWNVAFGGFRAFNYENYVGWMGEESFLNNPPPYRALPTRQPRVGEVFKREERDFHA